MAVRVGGFYFAGIAFLLENNIIYYRRKENDCMSLDGLMAILISEENDE